MPSSVGHVPVPCAGADERVGELGGLVALYCVARRVKSCDVWTLVIQLTSRTTDVIVVCVKLGAKPLGPAQ